jgi:AraC-like DNA-binding protein/mannose-6-phosphate isomerase-like protein (cupin superfamily)
MIEYVSKNKIETYSTEAFRANFIKSGQKLDMLLKPDYARFFIVKVEDMIRLMKLPVPPTRVMAHTFMYLTEGEAVMSVGSETYKIFKDECLFVPAGQVFSFKNVDLNKGYLVSFDNEFIVGKSGNKDWLKDFDFLQVWGNPCVGLDPQISAYVLHLLQRIYLDYSTNGLDRATLIQAYFVALLYEINSVYKPLAGNEQTQSVLLTNKFKELLFSAIRTKHLVTDYASALNITPNHLNKVIKQVTGKSPTHWIDDMLVLEAKVLLHQTGFPIGKVAAELGIADQSYFSRLFKKVEGITPLQFRKMIETS